MYKINRAKTTQEEERMIITVIDPNVNPYGAVVFTGGVQLMVYERNLRITQRKGEFININCHTALDANKLLDKIRDAYRKEQKEFIIEAQEPKTEKRGKK